MSEEARVAQLLQRHNIIQLIKTSLTRKQGKKLLNQLRKPPLLKPQGKDKEGEERNKMRDDAKKREIRVLPGASTECSTCGKPS